MECLPLCPAPRHRNQNVPTPLILYDFIGRLWIILEKALQEYNLWNDGGVAIPHHKHQVLKTGEHLLVCFVLPLSLVVQVSQIVGA